jgi:hypothetical protein
MKKEIYGKIWRNIWKKVRKSKALNMKNERKEWENIFERIRILKFFFKECESRSKSKFSKKCESRSKSKCRGMRSYLNKQNKQTK